MKSIIAPFVSDAQKLQQEKGIPASIILGQILLESSGKYNGLSGLAYEAKNLFGIKGTGTAGSVYMDTTEYVNGRKIISKEKFAKYKTYYDSMEDHSNLLLTSRYQKYLQDATTVVIMHMAFIKLGTLLIQTMQTFYLELSISTTYSHWMYKQKKRSNK